MPYIITGKVLGSDGYPIPSNGIMIEELSPSPAKVWADPETGTFVFSASSSVAIIRISTQFYKAKTGVASSMKGNILLDEDGVILEGTPTIPKNNKSNAWVLLAVFGGIVVTAVALKSKGTPKNTVKPVSQPKKVVV